MSIKIQNDAKEVFKRCGSCSRTFAHILNREFNHVDEAEEAALNPLAGGIMNQGLQCGMLWGAALAVGAEAYRRHDDLDKAVTISVNATQNLIASFIKEEGSVNCKDIIGFNLKTFLGMTAFMLKVSMQGMNNSHCFNLAETWAPVAVDEAIKALDEDEDNSLSSTLNCASEVVSNMGGTPQEIAMVSGFAGGLGLSGNGCGALSAAIWKRMLDWIEEHPGEDPPFFKNEEAKKFLRAFKKATNSELECHKICGRRFNTIKEHSEYIVDGGCRDLIEVLIKAAGRSTISPPYG